MDRADEDASELSIYPPDPFCVFMLSPETWWRAPMRAAQGRVAARQKEDFAAIAAIIQNDTRVDDVTATVTATRIAGYLLNGK
jgi:hypothetical protein